MSRRVSIVSGAASGIGHASARRLGQRGPVVMTDVNAERLAEAAEGLRKSGLDVHEIPGDVSEPETGTLLARTAEALGDLGAVVNAAGLSPTMAAGRRILEVNLVGTARLLEALLPLAGPGTAVVCIASLAGHGFAPNATPEITTLLAEPLRTDFAEALEHLLGGALSDPGTAYGVSKYGVQRLVIKQAPAWAARGARIISLSPGIIDTPMGRQEFKQQELMTTIVDSTPLRRMGTADEIAAVVEFLTSEGAAFVTGVDILVDGGSTNAMTLPASGDPTRPEL